MAFFAILIGQKRDLSHPEAENTHFWPNFIQILPFSSSSADMSHLSSMFPSINNLLSLLFDQPKKGSTPCGYYPSINDILCYFNQPKKGIFPIQKQKMRLIFGQISSTSSLFP
jgi:hypothetical protein